jgi:queuine/archaeosine tRNA-ribosyltransferase
MLSTKEKEEENSHDIIHYHSLQSIQEYIKKIKTAIVSRKYFESQSN